MSWLVEGRLNVQKWASLSWRDVWVVCCLGTNWAITDGVAGLFQSSIKQMRLFMIWKHLGAGSFHAFIHGGPPDAITWTGTIEKTIQRHSKLQMGRRRPKHIWHHGLRQSNEWAAFCSIDPTNENEPNSQRNYWHIYSAAIRCYKDTRSNSLADFWDQVLIVKKVWRRILNRILPLLSPI